jgi:hypothetical protein
MMKNFLIILMKFPCKLITRDGIPRLLSSIVYPCTPELSFIFKPPLPFLLTDLNERNNSANEFISIKEMRKEERRTIGETE